MERIRIFPVRSILWIDIAENEYKYTNQWKEKVICTPALQFFGKIIPKIDNRLQIWKKILKKYVRKVGKIRNFTNYGNLY